MEKRLGANQKCEFPSIWPEWTSRLKESMIVALTLPKTHAHAERSRRTRTSELHMYPNRSLACMMQTPEVRSSDRLHKKERSPNYQALPRCVTSNTIETKWTSHVLQQLSVQIYDHEVERSSRQARIGSKPIIAPSTHILNLSFSNILASLSNPNHIP
jgi:hypothetical protein